jgi:hypothetical protein
MNLDGIARRPWTAPRRQPRIGILLGVSAGCVAVLAVAAVGLAADPRLITGSPAWLEPLKFAVNRPGSGRGS